MDNVFSAAGSRFVRVGRVAHARSHNRNQVLEYWYYCSNNMVSGEKQKNEAYKLKTAKRRSNKRKPG
jgi:hypothetical protein